MQIEKLEVGKTFKYKELCALLEVEEKKAGKSRDYQFKEWRRFFEFDKVGQKYTITKIHSKPLEKIDNRGGRNQAKYIKNIELLILDLLAQDTNGEVFLSKNKLLRSLNMINDNYVFCKRRVPKLSKFMEIEQITVEEWYDSTDGMLKRNLEKALDNLRNQSLVIWSNAMTICQIVTPNKNNSNITKETHLDEFDEEIIEYKIGANHFLYREATKDEKQFILHTEREIMKKLNCENKQEIIKNGLWEQFNKQVEQIILSEFKIAFYYDSYKILFNEDHILEKHESLNLLLKNNVRKEEQRLLNDGIVERLGNNVNSKQDRALQKVNDKEFNKLSEKKKNKLLLRTEDNYLDNNRKLINTLIDDESDIITYKVKKTKLE